MRMWLVPTHLLCRKHLMGEHVELHMLMGSIEKGRNLSGFVRDKLINTDLIHERHEALVDEMLLRGYNHNSPLPDIEVPTGLWVADIDIQANLVELARRCPDCRANIVKYWESQRESA